MIQPSRGNDAPCPPREQQRVDSLPRHTRGLTLIELLVAIAIIGILIALLLPAIQNVREASRRTQCGDHLHNIGLAFALYHGTHKGLPPGYSPAEFSETGNIVRFRPGYAWGVHLLPYLEQKALFDQLDVNRRPLEEVVKTPSGVSLLQQRIAVFRCPDDQGQDTLETAPIPPDERGLLQGLTPIMNSPAGGTSNYVANCGYFETYHPLALIGDDQKWPGKMGEKSGPNNGLFYNASHVNFRDVTDGQSQTLAIGERAWFQGSATWVGTGNLRSQFPGGSGVCLGRVYWRINALPDPPGVLITPDSKQHIHGGYTARSAFGSYHPGGANFVFADGRVSFLSENVDSRTTTESHGINVPDGIPNAELLGVFQKLGIRNDGQPVGTY